MSVRGIERRLLGMAVVLVALGSLGVSAASARTAIHCEGDRFGEELNGDVIAGPGCAFTFTTVNGNVTVEPGGSLETAASTITGNVTSNRATRVILNGATTFGPTHIGGNVRLVDSTEGFAVGGVPPEGTEGGTIAGNLQITNGSLTTGHFPKEGGGRGGGAEQEGIGNLEVGGDFKIVDTTSAVTTFSEYVIYNVHVGGDFKVTNNELTGMGGRSGALRLYRNDVLGNFSLISNTAPAFTVDENTVEGKSHCEANEPEVTC